MVYSLALFTSVYYEFGTLLKNKRLHTFVCKFSLAGDQLIAQVDHKVFW